MVKKKEIAIEARDLTFGYRGKANIIEHLDLSLFEGETVALMGPNGAGKTTLGKLLAGILRPAAGELTIFGENGLTMPLFRIGQKVGYSFQNPVQQLFCVSVEEEIAFGLKYRGYSREHIKRTTEFLLNLFEIEHLRSAFPLNLSWGEKRRVALAACLALEPAYLVLDEPTTGMDDGRIHTLSELLGRLREQEVGMLLISHNTYFVEENAQRILHMDGGGITDDRYR